MSNPLPALLAAKQAATDLTPLLTVPQAAEALSMSRRYVELAIARKELRACHFGRSVRVAPADLRRFVEARKSTPAGGQAVTP